MSMYTEDSIDIARTGVYENRRRAAEIGWLKYVEYLPGPHAHATSWQHYAENLETGERVDIDHDQTETMSDEAFRAHVALGFPAPAEGEVWTNDTIIAAASQKEVA